MLHLRSGQWIGDFRISHIFPEGKGGTAQVVKAKAPNGGEVALKIHHLGDGGIIRQEAELLAMLDHPGIVRIVPLEEQAHTSGIRRLFYKRALNMEAQPWYFAMECLHGGSLSDYTRRGSLPVSEAAYIVRAVSQTIDYVHLKGYVHSDVKPENILFRQRLVKGGSSDPVLIDFGHAAQHTYLNEGGTWLYMSPEQVRLSRHELPPEKLKLGELTKVDVWAMGILLYRLLAGQEPFTAASPGRLTTQILHGQPGPIRRKDMPPELNTLILDRCLAKEPAARPDASALAKALSPYASNGVATLAGKGPRWF